jgi:hypothetical protein
LTELGAERPGFFSRHRLDISSFMKRVQTGLVAGTRAKGGLLSKSDLRLYLYIGRVAGLYKAFTCAGQRKVVKRGCAFTAGAVLDPEILVLSVTRCLHYSANF